MAMFARRLEPEHVAHAIEIGRGRLFIDAHSAIALDVRMPADRRDTRAGLAEISLEQQQIGDLLHQLRAFPVLGDPHAVRSEEHTSELQSLMRISYAVFCFKKKKQHVISNNNQCNN